jgi:putative transposase
MGNTALQLEIAPAEGRIHLVSLTAAGQRSVFDDFELARCVAEVGSRREIWRDGRLLAWVLMPDCWHGLVEVGPLDSLDTALARMRSLTARAARRAQPDLSRLWARVYEMRALAGDEDPAHAARRMVAHPLRAGLVQKLGDYAFWDAVWL